MAVVKRNILLSLLIVLMMPFFVCFSACSSEISYDDFKNSYSQMITKYNGVFFNENGVHINYSQQLQSLIDSGTPDDGLAKLSSDITNGQAIFEPILRTSFEAVNFLIDAPDTSHVTQNSLTLVQNKLNNLIGAFEKFKKDKNQLEEVSSSKQQVLNWLSDYTKSFKNAITKANDFALAYLDMYEKELLSETDVDGRIPPRTTTFLLTKNMAQSAQVYDNFVLAEVFDQKITTDQNFCNSMLENFLSVKNILAGDFNSIRGSSLTTYEENMLQNFALLQSFQTKLNNSIKNSNTAVKDFGIKKLRRDQANGTLTLAESACIKAVDELLDTDFPIVKSYNENIILNIKNWEINQGD